MMAAKGQSTEPTYQSLPRDEGEALLAPSEREEDTKPSVTITFAPIQCLRFVVIALSITSTVFICMPWELPGIAVIFAIISILLTLWSMYRFITGVFYCACCGKSGGSNVFDVTLGSFFCSFGFVSAIRLGSPQTRSFIVKLRPYLTNFVDFTFCCLLIIPGVLSFKTYLWVYGEVVGGLCITLASLQLAISFLSLFSVFRKVKLAFYKAEEHDKHSYTIPELYRDDMSERRASSSSEA